MARDPSLLDSHQPSSIAPASPAIAHVQLRDLLICPREKGVVNYVSNRAIVEQDMHAPSAPIRMLSKLDFTPNSLCYLPVGPGDTLIAAGGQEAEIHLAYHTAAGGAASSSSGARRTRLAWEHTGSLLGSINNSVLLTTSMSLARSNESSVEPRVGVSNNDCSIRFYDVPLHVPSPRRTLQEVGQVRLDVPINHSSISPDGRTLLSVGDANKIFFHGISGGARLTFSPITTLTIPPPDPSGTSYASASLTAAFSTAFSGDGSKFAVASQEGVVAVWDVRSTKPLKVFQTDKTRITAGRAGNGNGNGNGGASGWLSDDPWEWTRGTKAPGWCARSVKFNGGEGARLGKEVMAFTEHTSLIHVVDARTFETHDILRVPTMERPAPGPAGGVRATASASASTSNWYRPVSSIRSTTTNANAHANTNANANTNTYARTTNANTNTNASGSGSSSSRTGPGMESPDIPFSRIRRSLARRGIPPVGGNSNSNSLNNANNANARRTSGLSLPLPTASTISPTSPPASNPVVAALSRLEGNIHAAPGEIADQAMVAALSLPPAIAAARASSLDSAALAIMPSSSSPSPLPSHSTSNPENMAAPTPASIAAGLAPRAARRLAMAASIGRGLVNRRAASLSTSNATETATSTSTRTVTETETMNAFPETTPMTLGPSSSSLSRSTSVPSPSPSSTTPSTHAQRQATPAIVQALGDAFRIPMPVSSSSAYSPSQMHSSAYSPPASIGDSTWRTLGGRGGVVPDVAAMRRGAGQDGAGLGGAESNSNGSASAREARREAYAYVDAGVAQEEDGPEGIVVLPDLGDREMENGMHALFAVHGVPDPFDSRRQHSLDLSEEEEDGGVDVDADGDVDIEGGAEGDVGGGGERAIGGEGDALHGFDMLDGLLDADGDAVHDHIQDMFVELEDGDEDRDQDEDNTGDGAATRSWEALGAMRHAEFVDMPGDEDDYRMDVDDLREEQEAEEEDDGGDTEIDEDLEYECASVGNSRSGSPSIRGPTAPAARSSMSRRYGTQSQAHSSSSSSMTPPATTVASGWQPRHILPIPARALRMRHSDVLESTLPTRRAAAASRQRRYGYFDDLDIAGLCFDPWGERMYVAGVGVAPGAGGGAVAGMGVGSGAGVGTPGLYGSRGFGGVGLGEGDVGVGAVVEWSVRGAEKRWYVDDGWN